MSYLGSHLSSARGYLAMGRTALAMGADTFAFFLRNPRGGAARAVAPEDILALRALLEEHRFGPLVAHAPYTLNPCGKDPRVLAFARSALAEDLARMELMPGQLYNLHPGSHVGQGPDAGVRGVAATLDAVLHEPMRTTVLLETMSGKGSEVGGTFEELRAVIDRTALGDRLGVCLDTCHVWDAGYDIAGDLDGVLEAFDRALGLSRLRAVHLNDSQYPRGSHKDRHALLGRGCIGPGRAAGRGLPSPAAPSSLYPGNPHGRRRPCGGNSMVAGADAGMKQAVWVDTPLGPMGLAEEAGSMTHVFFRGHSRSGRLPRGLDSAAARGGAPAGRILRRRAAGVCASAGPAGHAV